MNSVNIISIGTSVPSTHFSQEEVAGLMGISQPRSLRFFEHKHIKKRHLLLSETTTGNFQEETPLQLQEKFRLHSIKLIGEALDKALNKAGLKKENLDFIVCVTSTSFIVPGLSALLIEGHGLRKETQRIDIVGMGCNAGLNGLNAVSNFCMSHEGKIGAVICCELCSCIYSLEDSENAALVNSLFGDGVAVALIQKSVPQLNHPTIVDSHSYLIPKTLSYLRFDWNESKHRYSFYVDKRTPEALANEIEQPLNSLLSRNGLTKEKVSHWIVHSGGHAILEALEKKLRLDKKTLRYTKTILENFGNVSSASFLFSLERCLSEEKIHSGDWGLLMTMGPGLTIEMALIKWP